MLKTGASVLVSGLISAVAVVVAMLVTARSQSRAWRQGTLLVASGAFYCAWAHWFALVLLASIVLNYFLGNWIKRTPRGWVLSVGILLNIAILCVFKYLPEAMRQHPLAGLDGLARIALPLGISFWTFQAISYLFDQYREEELDPSFVEFALYMSFFPVVVSGPVCRMPDMLPQFRAGVRTSPSVLANGLRRVAMGVLMMQIAKLLGQGILSGDGITSGFDRVPQWSGTDAWCLAIGFGLQLFFDFAGYSHIAIGVAQALGFSVPENFARPFSSTSPSAFWTRWHMSLSFWIRDYVFLPLALVCREMWWRNLALVLAMALFGIWHKASLLFLLWGLYHGVLLVIHRGIQAAHRRWNWTAESGPWVLLSWATTMLALSAGWIFFRSNSIQQAGDLFAAMFTVSTYQQHYLSGSLYALVFMVICGYGVAVVVADHLRTSQNLPVASQGVLSRQRWIWIAPLYLLLLLVLLLMTHAGSTNAAQLMYRNF